MKNTARGAAMIAQEHAREPPLLISNEPRRKPTSGQSSQIKAQRIPAAVIAWFQQ
jgi:hypothetical protein